MSSPLSITAVAPEKGLITPHSNHWLRSWKEMHQALIDAASQTALILQEPKPFVQTSLDDFYVLMRSMLISKSLTSRR
jgi:hypothetical protein